MRQHLLLALALILGAGGDSIAQQCEYSPTITSLVPSSGRIYPALYGNDQDITCTPAAPCTLSDMIYNEITSSQSPVKGTMAWYGSNWCTANGWSGLQGPVWWSSTGIGGGFTGCDSFFYPPSVPVSTYEAGPVLVGIGGGCSEDGFPTITPAQFGPTNNPLNAVNVEPAPPYQASPGNSLPFNLIGPDEMEVRTDFWEYCNGCDSTIKRITTYKVLNSDGSAAGNIPIGENAGDAAWNCTQEMPTLGANSCTVAKGQTSGGFESLGMGATNSDGLFTDGWSLNSDAYTPVGCGFKVVFDEWQLCGLAASIDAVLGIKNVNYGLTFATLSGGIHSNQVRITIGGTSYEIGPDNCAPDMPYPNCPYAIPPGTVIKVNSNDVELRRR
jgi:hypothetical protein